MNTQLEIPYLPNREPLRSRLNKRIKGTYRYDSPFWSAGSIGLWLSTCVFFTFTAMGLPTGWGTVLDIILFIAGGTLAIAAGAHLLAVLLAVTGLPAPRLFLGTLIAAYTAVLLIFGISDTGWLIAGAIAAFAVLAGALGGMAAGALWLPRSWKVRLILSFTAAILCAALIYVLMYGNPLPQQPDYPKASEAYALQASNPAEPGSFSYKSFTYGSGKDDHRKEFGSEAGLLSTSVDASGYLGGWSAGRTSFWGFGPDQLPLNGRVWMPEGAGPFPLVLLVHGNHLMEDYSDEGYAYLGELLASRGYIAVSVDENFLNYSAWTGIPDNDMKVRAWVLLKHLQQIDAFAIDVKSPFYKKVDFDKIALVGHSRGGQAVAMAADAKSWFLTDKTLRDLAKYKIRSVIALAPTDRSVDGTQARLLDINYLVLQGARDGDVNDFYGDRQYNRVSFSEYSSAIKSSLYIAGANHSQFNTTWGGRDLSFPQGMLLSRRQIMPAEEQRQVAKVYVSAFLEATIKDARAYTALFRDYRTGLQWLPDSAYFNRYEDAGYGKIADFDEDTKKNTINGGTAEGKDVTWTEVDALDRDQNKKGTRVLSLEWTKPSAAYSLLLNRYDLGLNYTPPKMDGLTFSMANLNYESGSKNLNPADSPEISIELEDDRGVTASLPLERFQPVLPLPVNTYTWNSWLEKRVENGKYAHSTEAVFQTYLINFTSFTEENNQLDPDRLVRVSFKLGRGPGKVLLDDIGYIKSERRSSGSVQTR
ncbi:alpha/beta hydrolase [Paenibacillus sp. CAA11]|uniref:alpha/beta hydrolase family protein n=1 Tax=Paenibacillus sp. CAA11 TaxID=1532905 RepID=UPI000D352C8E|nr:alpha/beta hydrolase [Paenibacillus sp. CAA11]AWB46829.1 alpha/beta hydrolase [Paenibacillus sp. CAA11]